MKGSISLAVAMLCLAGCGSGGDDQDVVVDAVVDAVVDTVVPPTSFTIMTFNAGTTNNMDHTYDTDGYGEVLADINTEYFGNNLAWLKARSYLRNIVDTLKPDVMAFQELFFDPECDEICAELEGDPAYALACDPSTGEFVCARWQNVDTSELTVRAAVGPDYEVACAPNHTDNCIAVRKGFGTLTVADGATLTAGAWIDGLDGLPPPDLCNKGARVSTGVVAIAGGPEIAVVDVHTVSGTNVDCRLVQLQQVFDNRGDGKPAAFGAHNIVLGDMNIDPFTFEDASVDYWNSKVGEGRPFHYLSSSDASGPMTHPASFSRLDHVISDNLMGSCDVLGVPADEPGDIFPATGYFDHRPVFCTVDLRQ